MFKTSNIKTNVSGGVRFIFDIVVVKLNLVNINVEEHSKLHVDVKFNNNNIKITSSRINVNEFKPGCSFEFNELPSVLKEKLYKNPLKCEVYYNSQYVGICSFLWPDTFAKCIAEASGRELLRCDGADVMQGNQRVGRMEIIVRWQMKCEEFEGEQNVQSNFSLCNPAEKAKTSNDVMFLVGQTSYGCLGCLDRDVIPAPASSPIRTCLDLSDFRQVHGKTVEDINILDYFRANCCKKENPLNQYKEILQNLLDKSYESSNSSTSKSEHLPNQLQSERLIQPVNYISDCKCDTCSSTDSQQLLRCISLEDSMGQRNISQKDGFKDKPNKRYCSLCHYNITWLPKYAACPKCGFRPILYDIEEKSYDTTLTANKILHEYATSNENGSAMKHSRENFKKDSQQTSLCRCKCKNGETCAHCRIRKLCEDILQPNLKSQEDCGKCENKSCDLYNICKTNGSNCRPYLVKVVQYLKNLFNVPNEEKLKTGSICDEVTKNYEAIRCLGQVNQSQEIGENIKTDKTSQSHAENVNEERKQFSMKTSQKQKSRQKKMQCKNRGAKNGNQACVSGLKIVPRNMGWLWNAETKGLRAGWMPGAIRKPIRNLMRYFLNENQLYSKSCRNLDDGSDKIPNGEKDDTKEHTLHIRKTDGVYYVTLRPLKAIGNLKECTGTYSNINPIQFKITKSPILMELRKIKQHLKARGFAKCICHKPISSCCCRSFLEKKKLEYNCSMECRKRELPNCNDSLILSDSSDSETEFDFGVTPPAGVVQPERRFRKREKVSSATQYEMDDWKMEQKYPKPLGKYFKLHNCAVGNRFGKAFGPYGNKGYSSGAVAGIYGRIGGRGSRGVAIRAPQAFRGPDGKFNMAQYLAYKAFIKPSPEELAERKRQKNELLKGVNPPLLCQVDRLGKSVVVCPGYLSKPCNAACFSDDRIC